MAEDKVQDAQEVCIVRVTQAAVAFLAGKPMPLITETFDALIAAVREDERRKCADEIDNAIERASNWQHNSQLWGEEDGGGTLYIEPVLSRWRGNA